MKKYIFLLFLLGVCISLSFVPKRREGLTSDEQNTVDKTVSIKALEEESLQLVRDARTFEALVKSSPLDKDANQYRDDTVIAYKELEIRYRSSNDIFKEVFAIWNKYNPASDSLKESYKMSGDLVKKIEAYRDEAYLLSESAKYTASLPRPTSAGYTREPNAKNQAKQIFSTVRPIPSDINAPSNTAPLNTAPLNNASPTIPVNSTAPTIGITPGPVKHIEKHYDWETGEPSETWEYVDYMNGISEKVDKKINEKEDGFVKYATHLTPEPEIILNNSPEVVRKNDIIANNTMIDYFKHLFKTYSEPFKTNVVLTNVNTNQTYDLRRNQEIYNEKGELKFGKYDDTDYDGFIREIELKKKQLENEKQEGCKDTIKCIADFDTQIGDKLCCGQKDTLKDTQYVCPENKPTCGNFKCGSNFGVCS